ncbi:MAG: hypothetical protein K9J13_08695 [Saprospiraceae bacterium]|nr:hypothetical protein [Saprospiraceae bacterium]
MSDSYKKFLLKLTLFTIAISAVMSGVFYLLPIEYKTPTWPYLILFFFSVTLIVHYILVKSTEKKFSKFTASFMLSTTVKLMLYLGVIVIYSLFYKDDAINFIITFFALYVLFTTFEVVSIVKTPNVKSNDK